MENYEFKSLHDTYQLRKILFAKLYNQSQYIESLKFYISKYIDCLSIDYDPNEWYFVIKIKKTSMRSRQGFKNDPIYYYSLVTSIYRDFLLEHKNIIAGDSITPEELDKFIYNPDQLSNLCQISCAQDNIIIFKL